MAKSVTRDTITLSLGRHKTDGDDGQQGRVTGEGQNSPNRVQDKPAVT